MILMLDLFGVLPVMWNLYQGKFSFILQEVKCFVYTTFIYKFKIEYPSGMSYDWKRDFKRENCWSRTEIGKPKTAV